MSAAAAAQAQKPKTESKFTGRDKEKDVRNSNCLAAKGSFGFLLSFLIHGLKFYHPSSAVADAVRTSLGPKGMDKMVSKSFEDSQQIGVNFFTPFLLDSNS